MIRFDCDYLEGAHPAILQRMAEINFDQRPGYETDEICRAAADKIRAACACPGAAVHYLVGGTQTNTTVICGLLRPGEGVIAAETAHINVHESGAIEGTGHKVLVIKSENGKLAAEDVENYYRTWHDDATWEHMVRPAMVYISHPTETGALYTRAELTALHEVCARLQLPLFLDGARLGYGLMARGANLTLADIAALADVFYIGGTKQGALFGEALVLPRPELLPNIRSLIKQRGGLMAKGWLLGVQFDVLFTDDLYFALSRRADALAERMQQGFLDRGYPMAWECGANQIFPALTEIQAERLSREFVFSDFGPAHNGGRCARFCTSWATTPEQVETLLAAL